jgi:hypothetical protein
MKASLCAYLVYYSTRLCTFARQEQMNKWWAVWEWITVNKQQWHIDVCKHKQNSRHHRRLVMFLQIIRAHNSLNSSQHRWAFYLPVQVQILHIFTASLHVKKTNASMTSRMTLSTDNETKQVPWSVCPSTCLVVLPQLSPFQGLLWFSHCIMVGSSC